MTTISLPAVGYQPAYPQLVESVSMSRAGNRAIAFVDYADSYWSITMRTVLENVDRARYALDTTGMPHFVSRTADLVCHGRLDG